MNDDVEICTCPYESEWIVDAGDGWQYCAACHKLAKPLKEVAQ